MTLSVGTAIEIIGEFERGSSTHGINLCLEGGDGVTLTAAEAEEIARVLNDAAALLREREADHAD